MAHPPHPNDRIALHRARSFKRTRAWAEQNAQACMTIETSDEEALDIRLGDRRQVFLVAPRQKSAMYFSAFGVLPGTPHRHGCPGRFLDWLQTTGDSAFPQAMFVSHLNAYSVSCPIQLDEWQKAERQLYPVIELLLGHINRLLACHQESNLLAELDSADAHALRTRFQEDTLASFAAKLTKRGPRDGSSAL